jgi:glycosyltransferase involved in cell wall biosynthesis
MKKKATVIFSISPFGNAISDYFYELARSFVKENYEVIIIFYDNPAYIPQKEKDIEFLVWPNKRPTKIIDFVFFTKLIFRYKPEIVFSNFSSTNVIGIVSFFLRVPKRYNYLHTSPTQLKLDSKNTLIKSRILNFRKKYIYKMYNCFFTNSHGTKDDFVKTFGIAPSALKVKPYLIKKSNLEYRNKVSRKKEILILGRLDKSKGHLELLKCFKQLIIEDSEYKLFIAGAGIQRKVLEVYIKDNGMNENVFFLGKVPYNKIEDYLSQSLIHVSSSYEEAFGLVNIEALREGTPILCTQTNGSKDIVEQSINGDFFDFNDPESFVRSVKKIDNEWDLYSVNALKSFKCKYSFETIENHFHSIIKIN